MEDKIDRLIEILTLQVGALNSLAQSNMAIVDSLSMEQGEETEARVDMAGRAIK
jgi:hypothetical protein